MIHLDNVLEELTYGARDKPRGPNISSTDCIEQMQDLDADVPGCRVCQCLGDVADRQDNRQYKNLHILISYFNVLPVSFTMSVNERTYIMIKVRCGVRNIIEFIRLLTSSTLYSLTAFNEASSGKSSPGSRSAVSS